MTRTQTLPDASRPMVGVVLMLGAMASLPFIDVFAKFLGQQGVPILLIVWARLSFGAAVTLPFALRHTTMRGLFPNRLLYHSLRAGFLSLATFSFFFSLRPRSTASFTSAPTPSTSIDTNGSFARMPLST